MPVNLQQAEEATRVLLGSGDDDAVRRAVLDCLRASSKPRNRKTILDLDGPYPDPPFVRYAGVHILYELARLV